MYAGNSKGHKNWTSQQQSIFEVNAINAGAPHRHPNNSSSKVDGDIRGGGGGDRTH